MNSHTSGRGIEFNTLSHAVIAMENERSLGNTRQLTGLLI